VGDAEPLLEMLQANQAMNGGVSGMKKGLYTINELLQIVEADLDSALNHLFRSGRYHRLKRDYPKLVARIRRAMSVIKHIQARGFPQKNYSILRFNVDYVKAGYRDPKKFWREQQRIKNVKLLDEFL